MVGVGLFLLVLGSMSDQQPSCDGGSANTTPTSCTLAAPPGFSYGGNGWYMPSAAQNKSHPPSGGNATECGGDCRPNVHPPHDHNNISIECCSMYVDYFAFRWQLFLLQVCWRSTHAAYCSTRVPPSLLSDSWQPQLVADCQSSCHTTSLTNTGIAFLTRNAKAFTCTTRAPGPKVTPTATSATRARSCRTNKRTCPQLSSGIHHRHRRRSDRAGRHNAHCQSLSVLEGTLCTLMPTIASRLGCCRGAQPTTSWLTERCTSWTPLETTHQMVCRCTFLAACSSQATFLQRLRGVGSRWGLRV
jgi:hypothetical protein